MTRTKMIAAVAATALVVAFGANAFATATSIPVKAGMTASPAPVSAPAPTAMPAGLSGDSLILGEKELESIDKMSPAQRTQYAASREVELKKMPAQQLDTLKKSRDTWFSALTSDKQKDFTSRLDKALELLGLKKSDQGMKH